METDLMDVYHYDVEISILYEVRNDDETRPHEAVAPKRLNRIMIDTAAAQQQWGVGWAYDGRKNIYAARKLMATPRTTIEVLFSERPGREQTAAVKLTLVKTISVDTLRDWVRGRQMNEDQPQEIIQALDVALRQAKHQDPDCCPIGAGFYYPKQPGNVSSLGRGIQLWRGMQQSVRPADGGISFNVDVAHATVYEELPIPVLLTQALGISEHDLGNLTPAQHAKIRGLLVLRQVVPVHLGTVVKTVQSITKDPASILTFKVPEPITVQEYFAKKGRILLHPEWPCADVGTKSSTQWIPFELLRLAPAQKATQLDGQQQAEMIRRTAQKPRERRQAIERAVGEHSRMADDPNARAFQIGVQPRMMQVNARILETPVVAFGGLGSQRASFQPDRGSWDLRNKKFVRPAVLTSFGIACMMPPNLHIEGALQTYMHGQLRELHNYGLDVPPPNNMPKIAFSEADCHPGYVIEAAFEAGHKCFGSPPAIIFVMLPDTSTEIYKAVKRATDSFLGVPSQCFVASKAGVFGDEAGRNKQLQYMGNLALKINSKLGGVNFVVPKSVIWEDEYIIFGADVTHPPPGSEEPSVAAVVASMDSEHARFAARVRVQARRLEVIKDLTEMVKALLISHYKQTGRIPFKIILYRDGVSEGQFKTVKRQEVTAMLAACADLPAIREGEPYYKPDITFIVAQKRHHTRFFPDGSCSDKNGNPLPGTVVDQKIVKPIEFSFYLNSHAGLQGTSSSCLYHVLLDQNALGMDQLQRLTYDLCYQFQRATKAVSLVPPAYYADLAAERGRCMIARVVAASRGSGQGRIQIEWAKINEALDATTFFI